MQPLPLNQFEWYDDASGKKDYDDSDFLTATFTAEKIHMLSDTAPIGYVLEVDLDYPDELHDAHNDYPFCAERQAVPNGKTKTEKLLLTLENKRNYVIHYRMLRLALEQGLILRRVHRVLQFRQSTWLKPYIDLNTEMRTKATSEFEKNFFKLMANAVYGKTMENVRGRVDISIKSYWEGRYGVGQMISQPNFKRCIIYDENLVAVEMEKMSITMNKPIAVGMAVLDLSKIVMYDYYYNHLKVKYGDKLRLAYTDTDSFIISVKTDCFYADMKENLQMYDTSDYPLNNVHGIPLVNKKRPGLFKDELNSRVMTEFVGLRSKMYSIRSQQGEKRAASAAEADQYTYSEIKKAKGIKKCVLRKEIGFDDYVSCLLNNNVKYIEQHTFRSQKHRIFTVRQQKIGLSPFDDKRHLIPEGDGDDDSDEEEAPRKRIKFDTKAYGHYSLQ